MSKTAAIYCRISDDREGRRLGVERQEQDCRALAEQRGYHVERVFVENDLSASTRSTKRRPLFEEMLETCETGGFDAIVAYSSSRLTRRPRENERLIELFEKHGVRINYVNTADNDLGTARGRRRARDDAARDAEEAEEISERVARASLQRAQQGRSNGSPRAYGWQPDHVTLDPYEHGIKVEIADRILAGESQKSVARDLTERGIPTASWHPPLALKPWTQQVIRKMLTNWRQCGLRVHNGEIMGQGDWQPALDEPVVRQLRDLLLDPDRVTHISTASRHLLTGLALCGVCDRPVSIKLSKRAGQSRRAVYRCQPCRLTRAEGPVDEYVTGYIVGLLETLHDTPDPGIDPVAVQRVERTRQRIEATRLAYAADDTMTPQDLLRDLRPLNARLRAEEKALTPPRRPRILNQVTGANSAATWSRLPFARKRAIIDELIEVRLLRGTTGSTRFDPESVRIIRR